MTNEEREGVVRALEQLEWTIERQRLRTDCGIERERRRFRNWYAAGLLLIVVIFTFNLILQSIAFPMDVRINTSYQHEVKDDSGTLRFLFGRDYSGKYSADISGDGLTMQDRYGARRLVLISNFEQQPRLIFLGYSSVCTELGILADGGLMHNTNCETEAVRENAQ